MKLKVNISNGAKVNAEANNTKYPKFIIISI